MSKRASSHVVLEGDGPVGGAKCLRCGAKLVVSLPCRVDDWCDAMRKFEQRHRECFDMSDIEPAPEGGAGALRSASTEEGREK